MIGEHDRRWLEKIHELGRLPAADMPGRLQARYLRKNWVVLIQGKHLLRLELTAAGRAAARLDGTDEAAQWREWAIRIALKLNCLGSVEPGDNGHIERAIDELEAIATTASQACIEWNVDDVDNAFIDTMDELRQKLEPWRKSRLARAEWLRLHAEPAADEAIW